MGPGIMAMELGIGTMELGTMVMELGIVAMELGTMVMELGMAVMELEIMDMDTGTKEWNRVLSQSKVRDHPAKGGEGICLRTPSNHHTGNTRFSVHSRAAL